MKPLLILLLLCIVAPVRAADGVEAFRAGLAAYQANGPDALFSAWYTRDDQAAIARIRGRLETITVGLGEVVATEVFAPRNLGKHIQRLYGVIYFRKRPLWVRAEYYSIAGQNGFISLEFSLVADDILPLEIGVASR
jgi:hypothetical protein